MMPVIHNNSAVQIGKGQRVTIHTGQQDCGCHACDLRRKMARPVTVRNEESKRESYLRQLDEKYSPEVVDSLLDQIVKMALQPVSGSAKAFMDQFAANDYAPKYGHPLYNAADDDGFEDFAMPGEETERRSGYRFQFASDPFASHSNEDEDEDFAMPGEKSNQRVNQRASQRPNAQPARAIYTNLHNDPDFEDFEMPKVKPAGNPYVTYRP